MEVVNILLAAGASCNRANPEKFTALHVAAEFGSTTVAQQLIERGASLTCVDIMGDNPLHVASFSGKADVLAELLGAATSEAIHMKNIDGNTPISVAVSNGHVESVKHLLREGGHPEPFHLYAAAFHGYHDVVQCLLDVGTSAAFLTAGGTSPLAAAAQENYPDVVRTLLALGKGVGGLASWIDALCLAAGRGHAIIIQDLLDAVSGADGGVQDTLANAQRVLRRKGMSPLHYATSFSNAKVVRILLGAGADEAAVNDAGLTPLDVIGTMTRVPPADDETQDVFRCSPATIVGPGAQKRWLMRSMIMQAAGYRARSWSYPATVSASPKTTHSVEAAPSSPKKHPAFTVRIFRHGGRRRSWFIEAIAR